MNTNALIEKINNELVNIHLNIESIYNNRESIKKIRQDLLFHSFYLHYNTNPYYKVYCDKLNVNLLDGKEFKIQNIPTIPSAFFKKKNLNLLSVQPDLIIKNCTSSGTSGNISLVPRDENSLTTFLSSITATLPSLFNIERTGNHKCFVLGPSTEDAGDLWFSYVISCMSMLMQTETFEKQNEIDYNEVIFKLNECILNNKSPFIIGPPFRILELANELNKKIIFPSNSFIVSAGGWKNKQRESISQINFKEFVKKAFQLNSFKNIRDSYNMVELNSVITECDHHTKHIPPWVFTTIWDPLSKKFTKNGEEGIICFYDASSFSYPCFIMSEDLGIIHEDNCFCGRKGQTIAISRRMNNIEARGCALKMAISKEIKSTSNYRFFQSFYR